MINSTKVTIQMKAELTPEAAGEVAKIDAWGRVIATLMNRVLAVAGLLVSPEFISLVRSAG